MNNDTTFGYTYYTNELRKNGFKLIVTLRLKKPLFWQTGYKITCVAINEEEFKIALLQSERIFLENPIRVDDPRIITINVVQILGYELIDNSTVIERKSSNFGKMIAGGLLFGGLGAVAGSMNSSQKKEYKTKSDFRVRLILDRLSNASVDLKCESSEKAYQLLYTLALLEERFYKKNQVDRKYTPNNDVKIIKETNTEKNIEEDKKSYYDEIMKIKDLCDKGIISTDEFETLKKRIINNS